MTMATQPSDTINLDSYGTPNLELERQGWGVPRPESWVVDSKFRQTDGRRRTSTLFKRFNRNFLVVRRQRRQRSLPDHIIDLTFVEPQPREIKDNRLWLWGLAMLCLIAPSLVYFVTPYLPLWGAPPVALAMLMMAMAWRGRKHHYEYLALNTDIPLFVVDAGLPKRQAAQDYRTELEGAIAKAQTTLPLGKQRIPLAVTEMRRLYQEGVIRDEDYESAKRCWFYGPAS